MRLVSRPATGFHAPASAGRMAALARAAPENAAAFRGEVEATGVADATIAGFLAALRAGQSRGYSSPVRM